MAQLEGYECDNCHKRPGALGIFGTRIPYGWYVVSLQTSTFSDITQHFCSKACLTAWAGVNPVPERAWTLFKRWLKAIATEK
jgi:hypothetical protein